MLILNFLKFFFFFLEALHAAKIRKKNKIDSIINYVKIDLHVN